MRMWLITGAIALLGCAAGVCQLGAAAWKDGPSGVHPAGRSTAVVWLENGEQFEVWRVNVATSKPQWTRMKLPAGVEKEIHARGGGAYGDIDVEVQGAAVHVLWFEDRPQSDAEFERRGSFPFYLVQASTVDGVTWRVDRTAFRSNPGFEEIEQYVAVDAQHAWLLAEGEPGAGQSPAALFTTADAGRTWKKVQDTYTYDDSGGMPIGSNGAHLLSVQDAMHAWFIATCPNCDDDEMLNASYTSDGGVTWHNAPLSRDYPGCAKDCDVSDIAMASASAGACFDAGLHTDGDIQVHFCSKDGGHSWSKPMAGPTVVPEGAIQPAPQLCCDPRIVYADGEPKLGITVHLKEMPADAPHPSGWTKYRTLETRDGGRTWEALDRFNMLCDCSVRDLATQGDDTWALFPDGIEKHLLLHSHDHGKSWQTVALP